MRLDLPTLELTRQSSISKKSIHLQAEHGDKEGMAGSLIMKDEHCWDVFAVHKNSTRQLETLAVDLP